MAYPSIDAPYGFKPVGLIGGQVYAGSTRNYPIAYNYGTAIYYGDFVNLTSGFCTQVANTLATPTVGVFLGCYYTNPTTKQRLWSQYYPGGVTAGDITAIIALWSGIFSLSGPALKENSLASLLSGARCPGCETTARPPKFQGYAPKGTKMFARSSTGALQKQPIPLDTKKSGRTT